MAASQMHALIGAGVLLVSLIAAIWASASASRSPAPGVALRLAVYLGLALLTVQVLFGADLWLRVGARPTEGPLSLVHVGGPILALAGGAYHAFGSAKNRTRNYAIAMWMTFALGLISYAIGEMGG